MNLTAHALLPMFLQHASGPVLLIMLTLLGLSLLSWTLILAQAWHLGSLHRKIKRFRQAQQSRASLASGYQFALDQEQTGLAKLYVIGFERYLKYVQTESAATLNASLEERLAHAQSQFVAGLDYGLSTLASIASVSPYIGLLGTVWGIMHTFAQLGQTQSASLQVIAPGIAEALITTGLGLLTAIPAIIAYNMLTHKIDKIEQQCHTFCQDFLHSVQDEQAAA